MTINTLDEIIAEAGFTAPEYIEAVAIRRKLNGATVADLSPEEAARWADLGPKWAAYATAYDAREAQKARQQQADQANNPADPSGSLGAALRAHNRSHSKRPEVIRQRMIEVRNPDGSVVLMPEQEKPREYRGSASRSGVSRIAAGLGR